MLATIAWKTDARYIMREIERAKEIYYAYQLRLISNSTASTIEEAYKDAQAIPGVKALLKMPYTDEDWQDRMTQLHNMVHGLPPNQSTANYPQPVNATEEMKVVILAGHYYLLLVLRASYLDGTAHEEFERLFSEHLAPPAGTTQNTVRPREIDYNALPPTIRAPSLTLPSEQDLSGSASSRLREVSGTERKQYAENPDLALGKVLITQDGNGQFKRGLFEAFRIHAFIRSPKNEQVYLVYEMLGNTAIAHDMAHFKELVNPPDGKPVNVYEIMES